MKNKLFLLISSSILVLAFIQVSHAITRTNVNDWYIKDFKVDIILNSDSSANFTEDIIADNGTCYDCHGIFRILPIVNKLDSGKTIKTPVKLISITDFNNKPYEYNTSIDRYNNTITYKIGDKDKTVQGINNYRIKYKVENVIRSQTESDEFYWNILGNYFDLEIDEFKALIHFPTNINQSDIKTWIYSGSLGSKDNPYAKSVWIDNSTLEVTSTQPLPAYQGITLSALFPKGSFTYWQPGWYDKYGIWIWISLPIVIFLICIYIWFKYGRDPLKGKTIVPEFDIPQKFSPIEMSAVMEYGGVSNNAITAGIVNLAVKKHIKITEFKKEGIFKKTDYRLEKLISGDDQLSEGEKKLKKMLFGNSNSVELSEFSSDTEVAQKMQDLRSTVRKEITDLKLIQSSSIWLWGSMIALGVIISISGFIFGSTLADIVLGASLVISGLIIFVFAIFMPRRTLEGAEMLHKIKGFKLYMVTAERYRAQFNEKENIFERFLPYAILFGLTKKWIETCKKLYGDDYFDSYHPYWYIGTLSHFNADSLTTSISQMSSSIGSSVGTSSGSGGSGGAGGGGGGGGGGGW